MILINSETKGRDATHIEELSKETAMITIIITNEVVGQARLYEFRNCEGKCVLVPTYRAIARDSVTNEEFEFTVTRSASRLIFELDTDRYGTYGECPPSKPGSPYRAFPCRHSNGSFCLRLYETKVPQTHNTIRGVGEVDRVNIMIHKGPSMSQGCLVIAGGKRGHYRFERWFKKRTADDSTITVEVLPCS
jgi:hypothetical protein